MLLEGKVVAVSGIGPGLGVKLAIHAGIEGARAVVISSRTPAALDDAERRVREAVPRCEVVKQVADICKAEDCADLAAAAERVGGADALVNNAFGHPDFDHVEDSDLDRWHLPFDVNVVGTLKVTQAFLPQMRRKGGGAIVMINTMGAKMTPIVAEASYCASKAALWSATRTLATEVGKDQIRVNGVHMGFMWGVPVQNYMAAHPEQFGSVEEGYAMVAATQAMRRIVTDDECARAALFLASDYSSAITGASLDANGGAFMP